MKYVLILLLSLSAFSFAEIPVYHKADLLGEFSPEQHDSFVLVSAQFSSKNLYLRSEVYSAFKRMAKDAEKDGVRLTIISGTRTHQRQTEIWEEKWNTFKGDEKEKAEEILLYSSMPGTSRHHWGTDFDLNSLEPEFFENGQGKKIYDWLNANAYKYGFFQPYSKLGLNRDQGYKEEKWHWSYYPIARQLLMAYNNMVSYKDITGFQGSELCDSLDVFSQYVNAIYVPRELDYQIWR